MKLNKFYVKIGLFCSILLLFAFIPKGDDPIDKLVAALQKWADTNPQEKVYLHMDKPYYALGDTVWFKAYVTIGSRHQLSALSGALYVDFITEKDSLIRSLKLPVLSGMVIGDFTLGEDLKQGNYRIRAYTQWMRNAGPEYFFDKTFTVGDLVTDNVVAKVNYQYKEVNGKPVLTAVLNYANDSGQALTGRNVQYNIVINGEVIGGKTAKTDAEGNIIVNIANNHNVSLAGSYINTSIEGSDKQPISRDFAIKANLAQTDIQFFPESGNLVNGVASHIGFKAVGVDGLGVDVKGKIVDEGNADVAHIETLHAGMGSFILKPAAGKTYTAQVSFPDGTTKNVVLPKAVDQGYVLGIFQPNKDSILVRINASANLVATAPTLGFIAHTNGETIFASPVKITRASTSIWLEKKSFPSGIAQFTIFDNAGEALNERIAFIRSNDMMQLDVKSVKTTYTGREPVKIDLIAKDSKGAGVPGNFSVAVIDENKVPVDEDIETTILSNTLLTSDLKGYIEKPNYYFAKQGEDVDKALDNLMLTQGYRRFTWKDLSATVTAKPAFEAEKLLFKISGTVHNLGTKVSPNARVTMVSLRARVLKDTVADANGRFTFDGILLTDSIKFTISAKSAKNSDKVLIAIDTLPRLRINTNKNIADVSTNVTGTLKAYLDNGKKLDDMYEKMGRLDQVHRLKEVRIRGRKSDASSGITPQGMFRIPEVSADKVITFPEGEAARYLTVAMMLQGKLQGISVQPDSRGMSQLINMIDRSVITLIVDGRKISTPEETSEILDGSIMPEDVAKVEVVSTNRAMVNFLGQPSVLIMTQLGTTRKQYNPSIANISPKGYNKVREFYAPKYDKPGTDNKLPDMRSTIYWNPYLKTDVAGKSTFSYFNADAPGSYKVVVEGLNAAGELGRRVYRYTVQ